MDEQHEQQIDEAVAEEQAFEEVVEAVADDRPEVQKQNDALTNETRTGYKHYEEPEVANG